MNLDTPRIIAGRLLLGETGAGICSPRNISRWIRKMARHIETQNARIAKLEAMIEKLRAHEPDHWLDEEMEHADAR